MARLLDPRHEYVAQLIFAGKTAEEASIGAGYDPAGTSFPSGARKRANRKDVRARVYELQQRAADRAEIDATYLLLEAKKLLEFNVDDYLTPLAENGQRIVDLSRATRDQLGRLSEFSQDEMVKTVGRKETRTVRTLLRTKIKGHDKIGTLGLMARIIGVERDPTADALTGIGDKLSAALGRVEAAKT